MARREYVIASAEFKMSDFELKKNGSYTCPVLTSKKATICNRQQMKISKKPSRKSLVWAYLRSEMNSF